ncbi:protein SPATA31F1 [Pogona vitticeps]
MEVVRAREHRQTQKGMALPAWRDSPRPPSQGQKERASRGRPDSPRSHRRRSIRRLLCDDPSCSLCQQVAEEAAELAYPRGPGLGGPLTRASQRESTHSSVSSTLDSSFSSWTQGSISSSGCSVSLRSVFSWSLQVESEEISSFSESTRRSQATRKGAHRKSREGGCRHCRRRHRRKGRAPAFQGVALETPFLGEEARASLEGHLLRKQVQHALGLPATLLRSLRAFMPLAPNSVARSAPRSPVLALCPQPLPFLKPHDTRAELEKHLKKMVHLRRWGLPRRVQDALRHLRPGSETLAGRPLPPAPKTSRLPVGRDLLRPSSPRSVRREAGGPELAHDRRHVHVACPHGSSAKGSPHTPEGWPWMGPSARPATLESHILKKRLQHQWGLPRLARDAMEQFLPAPPRPTASRASPQRFLGGENAWRVLSPPLPFIPRETQDRLESHVQRLLVRRQWGLPWRVMESLRVFLPVSPPLAEKPKETRSLSLRRPRRESAPAGSGKLLGSSGRPPVERHLAQNTVAIQLGALLGPGRSLRATGRPAGKQVLPKIIRPGQRAALPRQGGQGLLFVDPGALSRVELNITHKRLAYKWGLPTLYTRSLARLCQGITPPGPSLGSPVARTARVTLVATETRFLARERREALDWHVKKKQLQHLWGLPGLVQGSLRRLLPSAPGLCPPRGQGHEATVAVLRSELSFLPKDTQQRLEANVRKRVALQRWGLPRLVLRSLRQLLPEVGLPSPGVEGPQARGTLPGSRLHFRRAEGTRRSESRPARRRGPSRLELQDLQRLTDHLAKKSVEMHLGALCPPARVSRQLARLDTWQPLPKLIHPGQGTWPPRRLSLPFLPAEDMGRIELSVFRRHLSYLWGLAPCYVGALAAARVPQPSILSLKPRGMGIEFSEGHTPFLPQSDREALEQHLRRKRMQHEWGVPASVQRSLKAFLPASPPLAIRPKATIQVSILRQDALFLPRSVLRLLERHVQKRTLHRRWGLPRRVLGSLRLMCPKSRGFTSRQAVARQSSCHALAGSGHGGPPDIQRAQRRILSPAARPPVLLLEGTKHLEEIRLHLAKKYVEEHLGAFPALVQRSRRQASRGAKKPLPKLIPPGQRLLQARRRLRAFEWREDRERIELAVRHHHLMSLWGLGPRCTRAMGGMLSRTASAPPHRPRRAAALVSLEVRLPFLREQAKEALEQHAKEKRIRHMWGCPVTIQRSLQSFMDQPPPSVSLCPKAPTVVVRIQWQELSFCPPPACRHLERHVLKMKLQRLWRLPGRVLRSLQVFSSSSKEKPEKEHTKSRSRAGRSRSSARGSRGSGAHAQTQGETVAATSARRGPVPQGTAAEQRGRKGPRTKPEAPSPRS